MKTINAKNADGLRRTEAELKYNNEIMKKIEAGSSCSVLGLGISNLPLIDFLIQNGAKKITARDKKSREELGQTALSLEEAGVRLITGEKYLDGIDEDIIFLSPGIRPDAGSIPQALSHGAELTSEMELFMELTDSSVFAVTGSDGKTTTTTLAYLFLKAAAEKKGKGRVYVGGNIGSPLLPHVAEMTEDDFSVLELSSFQLMTLKSPPLRAAITNISPNHLNWHTGMEEYIEAKRNICGKGTRLLVLNADNEITAAMAPDAGCEVVFFSSSKKSYGEFPVKGISGARAIFIKECEIVISDGITEEVLLDAEKIKLPGKHNVENYMTAMALTYGLVPKEIYTEIALSFGGVEHRLEFVRTLDSVDYYNSSIDSSPTRTAAALSALKTKPVVICGGYDKKIPFEPLAVSLCKYAETVVLTGATAEKIKKAILECPDYRPEMLGIIECPDFDGAVTAARRAAHSGGTVLLSPACASFDAFRNFEERGKRFKEIVNSWTPEK